MGFQSWLDPGVLCSMARVRTEDQKKVHRINMQQWREANPEKYRSYQKSRRLHQVLANSRVHAKENGYHPIEETAEELRGWLEGQPKICPICGSTKNLVIDHCHRTGKLRGLVCRFCNMVVSLLEDKQELITRCTEYIKEHLSDTQTSEYPSTHDGP